MSLKALQLVYGPRNFERSQQEAKDHLQPGIKPK
jgi:hypothetical protein